VENPDKGVSVERGVASRAERGVLSVDIGDLKDAKKFKGDQFLIAAFDQIYH
jgi:hypothetical protein